MKLHKTIFILFFALAFWFIAITNVYSNHRNITLTDETSIQQFYFFDLRERESFAQITNVGNSTITIHVQIHNVDQDCDENNFYDTLTANDTHVYNMRDIQTNNGNPSGVVLPENAYGSVSITYVAGVGLSSVNFDDPDNLVLIGNLRIIDNNGYEYRTNSGGYSDFDNVSPTECGGFSFPGPPFPSVEPFWTFNFNTNNGIILSDIIILTHDNAGDDEIEVSVDPVDDWALFNVDILDLNENAFSCRNVIYSCIDQDNPRIEELLEVVGDASVASFEYGINEVIPSSKNAPLLCPGNTIEEGFVRLEMLTDSSDNHVGFIGLNNGNGRGSMDMFWSQSCVTLRFDVPPPPP